MDIGSAGYEQWQNKTRGVESGFGNLAPKGGGPTQSASSSKGGDFGHTAMLPPGLPAIRCRVLYSGTVDDDDDILAGLGGPRDPDSLTRIIDRSVVMAGRRRRALAVLGVVCAIGAGWIIVSAFRADTGLNLGGGGDSGITLTESEGFVVPENIPVTASPLLPDGDGAVLDAVSVISAGDGAVADRVDSDPDLALLAASPGSIRLYGLTFNTRPTAAMIGPTDWFVDGCIQIHVAVATEPVYSTWVAGSAGTCRSEGVGVPATPSCVGDGVLLVPLLTGAELPDDTTPWTISADVFRTDLPDEIEFALLSGTVTFDRQPGVLAAAGAVSGEVLTLESPTAPSVQCLAE